MVMTPLSFPFKRGDEESLPWTLWAAQSPVASLLDHLSDEGCMPCPVTSSYIHEDAINDAKVLPGYSIQRPQYAAVLDRMNKANRKTGTFTSWTT